MLDKKKLKKLKLIVFDLDGTLLNSNGEIGKESIRLVKELKKLGVRFTFASGRLHSAIVHHARTLNLETPLISLDGSLIKSLDNEIIFESYIPTKYVNRALKYADYYMLKIALCHADAIYYTHSNSVIPDLIEKFGAKYVEVDSYERYLENVLEIVIVGEYKGTVKYVVKKMSFPHAFGLNVSFYKSHRKGDIYFCEARKHGVSKGKGLTRLAKYLKISIHEVAVLGDWYNDLQLFKTDALKIAMANAVSEIKSLSDLVTKRTNDEDGVAEFLELVLKAKK
ncbi:MAG: Cof-type HAD-IIB family hydrolase [Bacteroidota bacterium]